MNYVILEHSGGAMPEFTTVSITDAQLRTTSGRQKTFLHEYADYIQQLPKGQAGKLHVLENENPLTIRRWLVSAAEALGVPLVIKRSGADIYFWREEKEEEPRNKRSYTRRNRRGRAGDYFPPQPFIEPELSEQGVSKEEFPELGQLASEAERRVEQS
jgi:hypothetical protein